MSSEYLPREEYQTYLTKVKDPVEEPGDAGWTTTLNWPGNTLCPNGGPAVKFSLIVTIPKNVK